MAKKRTYKRDRNGRFAGGPIGRAAAKRISRRPSGGSTSSVTFRAGSIRTRRVDVSDAEVVLSRRRRYR